MPNYFVICLFNGVQKDSLDESLILLEINPLQNMKYAHSQVTLTSTGQLFHFVVLDYWKRMHEIHPGL